MAGSTTELSLSTAVDTDDNADYLTINLANSLRTVDGLFNNVTGHNHGGAHQGGVITPAAGSITSGMIADGTIATADLANAAVTNAKLGSDTARANLLTNGGFEVWQRGNGPFVAGGAFTADRWQINLAGTDTLSVSKDTTNQDASFGSAACAACTFTLSGGAGGTSLFQILISTDGYQLRGRTVSVSVRVRTATANAVRLGVTAQGSAAVNSSFHTGDGTWQTLTAAGVSVGASATYVSVNVYFAVSCTAYLDNAMLVVGSQPADYAPLHPADDLARCLRYYEIVGIDGEWAQSGYTAAAVSYYLANPLKAVKPVMPTVTRVGTFSNTANANQPTADVVGKSAFRTNVTTNAAGTWYSTSSGSAYWTVEANP